MNSFLDTSNIVVIRILSGVGTWLEYGDGGCMTISTASVRSIYE